VKNGKEPAVLAKRLAALAQEKVKGLKLHYLKP